MMTPIEKLARDICWAEWPSTPKHTTKPAYWKAVHPDKKAEYVRDAEWLGFIVKALKPLRVLMMVDFPATPPPMGGR
jgi:hypothetical protein